MIVDINVNTSLTKEEVQFRITKKEESLYKMYIHSDHIKLTVQYFNLSKLFTILYNT